LQDLNKVLSGENSALIAKIETLSDEKKAQVASLEKLTNEKAVLVEENEGLRIKAGSPEKTSTGDEDKGSDSGKIEEIESGPKS